VRGKEGKAPLGAIAAIVVVVIVLPAAMFLWPRPPGPRLVQPPSAPLNLEAAPGDRVISLSWQPPADNGSSPLRHFRVYRGTVSGDLGMIRELDVTLSYTDGGLTNGLRYYYRVSAVSQDGEGARSGMVSAVPGGGGNLPSAPRNLTARPGDGQVTLGWDPPADTGGTAIAAHRIYRGNASGALSLFTETGSSTTYTNTGLQNGVTYYFQVSAVNSAGEGPRSAEASAVPSGGPTVPSAPRNLTYVPGASNVTLDWEPPESDGGAMITGYSVYRGTAPGSLLLLSPLENLTTYVDEGLLPDVRFYYQVSARNALGNGPRTPELLAMPLSKPSAPRDLAAAAGLGQVTLSWQPPSSDGGSALVNYLLYRGTEPGNLAFLVLLPPAPGHVDSPLINGTTYSYQVSASNAQGEGPRSAEVNATPQSSFDTPSAPRDLIATEGDGRVDLTWSAPASEGGSPVSRYSVYRDGSPLTQIGVATAYSDSGLTNGQARSYEVSATNSYGEGPRSAAVSATPATVPGAPTGLAATGSNRNVSLSWQAPASDGGAPITGYAIFRDGASLVGIGTETTYRDGTVTNGRAYTYKVAAVNRMGRGPFSNEASATPDLKPVAFSAGGTGFDTATDIGTDAMANIYVTGHFRGTVDFDPGTGVRELTSAGENDIFVAKYDSDGNYVWAFRVGGTGADIAYAIFVEGNGDFRLAGAFSLVADFDPGAGTISLASYGDLDAFAASYGGDGACYWAVSWGGAGRDEAYDISVDSAGNSYATGYFNEVVDFDPGTGTASSTSAGGDVFVSSLAPAGTYRWHLAIGSTSGDSGRAIQAYANGTFWVAGAFNGSVDFDPGAEVNLTNASGQEDVFLARYSSSGGFLWAGAIGGQYTDRVALGGLSLDSAGNVYITGTFSELCDFQPTNQSAYVQGNGGTDAFIAEYDQSGEYRWAYGVGGPNNDGGTRVSVDDSGNIFWTGFFTGTQVDFDLTIDTSYLDAAGTGYASDIFLAKYLPGGLLDWALNFGAAVSGIDKSSAGLALCIDVNGNVVFAGKFHGSADFDPTSGTKTLSSNGDADLFVVRLDLAGKPA